MPMKKKQSRTGAITAAFLNYLNMLGIYAWRNNTIGVYSTEKQTYIKPKRSSKGAPDILGIDWNGKFIAIEIKTGKDRLSKDQTIFAAEFIARKGIYVIAEDIADLITGLQFYGYNINSNGMLRGTVRLEHRLISIIKNIPNANKLRKLNDEDKQLLTNIVGQQKHIIKNVLGKYSERVI